MIQLVINSENKAKDLWVINLIIYPRKKIKFNKDIAHLKQKKSNIVRSILNLYFSHMGRFANLFHSRSDKEICYYSAYFCYYL